LILSLFITLLSAQNLPSKDGILILNESNFAKPLSKSRFVLILFYESEADQLSIKEFVETSKQLKELYSGVKLARIEGSTNKTRTDMYKVSSYPALRLFINDDYTPAVYEGDFKTKAIIDWMTSKIAEQIVEVKAIEEAEKIVTTEENVAFYFGSKEASAYSYLLDAISNLGVSNTDDEDLVFAAASDAMILEYFELVSDETSLIMFRDYDDERSIYPVPFTAESMRAFLNARKYAAVMPFNTKALTRLNDKKENGIILFQGTKEDKEASEAFEVVAGEFRDMIAFIEIGGGQKNQLAKKFDLGAIQSPAIGIVGSGNKRFLLDRKLTEKSLKIFLVNYLSDNLVPYQKKVPKEPKESKEPSLKEGYDGDVKVLEKANFKNVVLTEENDVLVEFYNPHCGHCIHFAPHYATLATKLKSVEGLILGKFDATKPRPEGVKIKYYPQLMYYRKGDKENPIEYKGNRKEDDLIKFIKNHATVPMKGF